MDDVVLPPTTNHFFPDGAPTDRRSSRVNTVTVIHKGECGHLDSLVLSENNARSSTCGGGGGHRRSGSSQKGLTSLYGRGKCDD